ncbi:hypothetical protein [Bradyrhizobium sp.]|nr:hypothetical protein [Bradyrhizobium sp.]
MHVFNPIASRGMFESDESGAEHIWPVKKQLVVTNGAGGVLLAGL